MTTRRMAGDLTLPRNDHDVVSWVGELLRQARALGASDLHIDPQPDGACLRLRIHGLLEDWLEIPALWLPRLVSRIKVMAQMDLAERRLPQDGRLLEGDGQLASIRVASLPTLYGEKLCLRLGDTGALHDLSSLALPAPVAEALTRALSRPDGLILITGPTGSGKTTTLYACLQRLNERCRHIATVEDPIERILPGINQTAIQPRIGLDFATILRALLRQDPDVLMVGEIRDRATAEMAVQASETGHLVLSTLHTGSALEALTRLRHLGVPDYLLADSVRLVLAQRLVRRLCRHCRQETSDGAVAVGCRHCHDGYDGRLGLYECVVMTPALAAGWLAGQDSQRLQAITRDTGLPTLQRSARDACRQGLTSAREISRGLGHLTPEQLAGSDEPGGMPC